MGGRVERARAVRRTIEPKERSTVHESEEQIEWPLWVPITAGILPTVTVAAALWQRHAVWPFSRETLLGAIVVLPFLLDSAFGLLAFGTSLKVRLFGRELRVDLPPLIFSAIAIGGTTGLLLIRPVDVDVVPFVLVLLTGEMAARLRRAQGIAVAGAAIGVMIGVEVLGSYDGSFIWVLGIFFGYWGGYMVQSQMKLATELREAQKDLAEGAAADERSRIAREVHDVIAHSMSVTMLHVTAARMALERGQSPEALDSLREAETQGRNSLNDIRRTVGLLGTDDGATEPPMPTAADLPKLIMDFRAAGLDVTLWMDGDVQGLGPGAGLNIYRIVQESLTNATKHAPGAKARVELNVTDDDVRLRVHNGPSNGATPGSAGGGLGLRGMAERAAMLGATFAADSDERGWTVFLVAPRASD